MIRILGVNQIGAESGNDANCTDRDVPWLQDTAAEQTWVLWAVAYRDVVILDKNNVPVAVYNLTLHDLGDPASYAELKALLEDVEARP